MIPWFKTICTTLWQSWWGPSTADLPAPQGVDITTQRAEEVTCGPAAAMNVLWGLGIKPSFAGAKTHLLGTYEGGTSIEGLVQYLNQQGASATYLPMPRLGVFEAVVKAVQGGAYAIPLLAPRNESGLGHFLVIYGTGRELVKVVDSAPHPGGHRRSIGHRALEREIEVVGREPFRNLAVLIIVRAKAC